MRVLRILFGLVCLLCLGTSTSPTIIGVTAVCGDRFIAEDPFSPHRGEVAIQVELANLDPLVTVSVELNGRLPLKPISASASVVTAWFPIEEAAVSSEVTVALENERGAVVGEAFTQDMRLECVSSFPANNVIVRVPAGVACNAIGVAASDWDSKLVAQTSKFSYCTYAWQGDPAAPHLVAFSSLRPEYAWEVDGSVVAVAAPAAARALPVGPLLSITDRRLGIDDLNKWGWPKTSLAQVKLAVLDTAAHHFLDPGPARDTSQHGRLVGLIAERTACGDSPSCPVEIDNRLGLSITRANYQTDTTNGGFIATRGQIASTLNELLDDWEQAVQTNGPLPLILNASLGWHSKHDCRQGDPGCGVDVYLDAPSRALVPSIPGLVEGTPGDGVSDSLASEAVFVQFARARCLGALVFAAAGNAVGGDREGPLLPGGWNRVDMGAIHCEQVVPAALLHQKPQGALVSAVGAVGFNGHPIALTRNQSLPRLIAPGVDVAVADERVLPDDENDVGITGPLSGTSVSTAIVSGAAARLWAQLGSGVPAHLVEAALFEAAVPATSSAAMVTLCDAQTCTGFAREITACTALSAASVKDRKLAPLAAGCSPERSALGLSKQAGTVAPDAIACRYGAAPVRSGREQAQECLDDPDPERVDIYEAPWVMPQPSGVRCARCTQRITTDSLLGITQYRVDFGKAETYSIPTGLADRTAIRNAFIYIGGVNRGRIAPRLHQTPSYEIWGSLSLDLSSALAGSMASLLTEFNPQQGSTVLPHAETELGLIQW